MSAELPPAEEPTETISGRATPLSTSPIKPLETAYVSFGDDGEEKGGSSLWNDLVGE